MDRLMTVKDLTEYLQLSQSSIYQLIRKSSIPVMKIGRQWRFRKEEIDKWLGQKQTTSYPL